MVTAEAMPTGLFSVLGIRRPLFKFSSGYRSFSIDRCHAMSFLIRLSSLCSANAVDLPQAAYLDELIDQGDVQVRKVFYEYEQDKNAYKLIAALKAYNKPVR